MATELTLQEALLDRCDILGTNLGLSIDAPNKEFTTPDGPYLEVRIFRNVNGNYGWAEGTSHIGILQISYITNEHAGSAAPIAVCDQISAFFAKDIAMWNDGLAVKVTSEPSILTEIQDGKKSTWPVSIPYACRVM